MSKKQIVEIVADGGNNYGQISSPEDFMKSQEFAHLHTDLITKDFLTHSDPEIAGCDYTNPANTLNFNVTEGRIYYLGSQYDAVLTNLVLTADSTHPRLDYVVASIQGEVPVASEFLSFQRLRTSQELTAQIPPYPHTQFQRNTQKQNLAIIQIRSGTPSANPAPPIIQPGDVLLYTILIPANSTALTGENVTDVRYKAGNLRDINDQVGTNKADIQTLVTQMTAALAYEQQPKLFPSFGRNDTLLGILKEISEALIVLKYRYPTIISSDSKCPAAVVDDGGKWAIDIPVGTFIQFGTRFVPLVLEGFQDQSVHPRYGDLSPQVGYKPIFDGEMSKISNISNNGNVIRFDAPTSTAKSLFVNINGELIFKNTSTPSTSTECLLLKITPKGENPPVIKQYFNARNAVSTYSGVVTANAESKQFENDLAIPPGVAYVDFYAIKSADQSRYQIPSPASFPFDEKITVPLQ